MTIRGSILLALVGISLLVFGVAVIYWPAGLVVGGLVLAAFGLFAETK